MTGNKAQLTTFLQLRWLGRERVTAYSCIFFAVLLAGLVYYFFEATGKTGSDFLAFWSAGRLVAQGATANRNGGGLTKAKVS